MSLNIGTANYHQFPYGINGKVVVLGVPILKLFRVYFAIMYRSRTLQNNRLHFKRKHISSKCLQNEQISEANIYVANLLIA